ncbi:resolvase [Streptomyces sp. NPDC059752]|uniref:resolvase n=1 Tax=unclassified Streptomyces TaxID=2593676 RepID=UPI00365430F8
MAGRSATARSGRPSRPHRGGPRCTPDPRRTRSSPSPPGGFLLEGRSIAALARDHDVSRGAIRTAVADLLPEYTAVDPVAPAPESPVVLDVPGKVADFLRATGLGVAGRDALDQGVTIRRGRGVPTVPARRKARRAYETRVTTLGAETP